MALIVNAWEMGAAIGAWGTTMAVLWGILKNTVFSKKSDGLQEEGTLDSKCKDSDCKEARIKNTTKLKSLEVSVETQHNGLESVKRDIRDNMKDAWDAIDGLRQDIKEANKTLSATQIKVAELSSTLRLVKNTTDKLEPVFEKLPQLIADSVTEAVKTLRKPNNAAEKET